MQELGELPDTIKIAEGGFDYSDEDEMGFDGAAGMNADDDDEEEEKKQAVNVNDI